jgi:hypothetical protein
MYDTAQNNQFPAGAQAYAAYVDGSIGNQPNYAYIVRTFPRAYHLSIALFASDNADALDVEPGAASPGDVPAWYARQKRRGIQRPCVYASASTMAGNILPVLSQAKIGRSEVRLWSAHYGLGEHICGPRSCGAVPVEADGTRRGRQTEISGPVQASAGDGTARRGSSRPGSVAMNRSNSSTRQPRPAAAPTPDDHRTGQRRSRPAPARPPQRERPLRPASRPAPPGRPPGRAGTAAATRHPARSWYTAAAHAHAGC